MDVLLIKYNKCQTKWKQLAKEIIIYTIIACIIYTTYINKK